MSTTNPPKPAPARAPERLGGRFGGCRGGRTARGRTRPDMSDREMTGRQGTMLRLGILTPVLTLIGGSHAAWEADGTIDDVARIARAADDLGYDHLTCSEHVAVPEAAVAVRGGRYWDPLAT